MFSLTDSWRRSYPQAHAGVLVLQGVRNPANAPELDRLKLALEGELRALFAGRDRKALEAFGPIPAYGAYYKRFKKTYHVKSQLESIAFKGRSIPKVAALVEAMFMAEVKNQLLTAGHDLDRLELPLRLGVADGTERCVLLRGEEQTLKAGDMMMADGAGVVSSIVYGPDRRTQITPATQNVLFAVYAPDGIPPGAVAAHLADIRDYALLIAPTATVALLKVFDAASA